MAGSIERLVHPAMLVAYARGAGIRVRRSMAGHRRHDGAVSDIVSACVDA